MTERPPNLRFELDTGVSIAADHYGDPTNDTVVFLHGGGQTRHAWGAAADALAKLGFYAICMDHRGHGDSSWSREGDYTLDAFASDLLDLRGHLNGPPIVVGASLGGISALRAEALADEPVWRGLVLVDTTPRMQAQGVLRILDWMLDGLDGFASLEDAANAIAAYLPHRERRPNLSGLKKNLRLGEDGRYRWHWDPELIRSWDPKYWSDTRKMESDIQARLDAASALTIPVLLVRGRMSDVVSEENAKELLERVPHAEYVDLEGAAHMAAGDDNDAFTASVADFILRHFAPHREIGH